MLLVSLLLFFIFSAVGVGGFGLMANGALMIHVFNDTPDDQIELIRRRVKVGFKFSGDVFIEKIQDEIAIREQVLPVNAYSSAVSGGHSDIVEGTLPIREQEGMGPGGRIYTNNSRMEALETILDRYVCLLQKNKSMVALQCEATPIQLLVL